MPIVSGMLESEVEVGMSRWLSLSVVLLLGLCPGLSASDALYEVPGDPDEVVGAWDVNIMADDVHFQTASIIREIRMPMSIAGIQTCTLWIFDALNSAPLHTQVFENVAAMSEFSLHTYVFNMQVQVPKDIYIGFSAQGGGWGATASDFWSWGTQVLGGVTGTAGVYYYGPVAGEQLTTSYLPVPPAHISFGSLEIQSDPVQASALTVSTGRVSLTFASLPIYASNVVERSESLSGTNWQARGSLPAGASTAVWSENGSMSSMQFYRVKSR
jgi:hypothetical protein